MPRGVKRVAEDDVGTTSTRPKKFAKTTHEEGAPKTKAQTATKETRRKKKAATVSEFKEKALPLHVHLMHNPPPIDKPAAATQVPGFIGHLALAPTNFSTGSYGWKGSKKILVELERSEGEGGEKEKVWVQLNINATVVGSKEAAKEGESEDKGQDEGSEE